MRLLIVVLVLGFAGQAQADGFGPRFSGNAPAAFLDGGASLFLRNIEPAAGGEDDAELIKQGAAAVSEEELRQGFQSPDADHGVVRIYPEPLNKN